MIKSIWVFWMIENKLGIRNYSQLEKVEREIITAKIKLLDDYITFNMDTLNLEFLMRIHHFLFEDIYDKKDLEMRNISDYEQKELNRIFDLLMDLGLQGVNIDIKLTERLFKRLWYLQLFGDGNTRTLLAFLKLYIEYYRLPLQCNIDIDIKSSEKVFTIKPVN